MPIGSCPAGWSNRIRGIAGAAVSVAAPALLLPAPATTGTVISLLAVLGIGLGMYLPANNTAIMAVVPARMSATAGGMVNMTRGVGTALGVALVTVALHMAGHGIGGARCALAIMAVGALAVVFCTIAAPVERAT